MGRAEKRKIQKLYFGGSSNTSKDSPIHSFGQPSLIVLKSSKSISNDSSDINSDSNVKDSFNKNIKDDL